MELINTPTVMVCSALRLPMPFILQEKVLNEKFRSRGGSQVQLFCTHGTRKDCQASTGDKCCTKLHFKKIIHAHTDGE